MNNFINLSKWVIVFDIDDTLISEFEYQLSGVRAIEEFLSKIYNKSFQGKLLKFLNLGCDDFLSEFCKELNFPEVFKESLLWTYRLHLPDIKFHDGIDELIVYLKKCKANLAILSDGRSITQRLKLEALGLNNLPSFISEEYSSDKFSNKRFLEIQKKWPDKRYVYIGDNAEKDFLIPNELGWLSIGADWIDNKVHSSEIKEQTKIPDLWVKNPNEVINILIKNL